MKSHLLLLFIISLFIFSCQEEKQIARKFYYPVDSVLKAQISYLTHSKARLTKRASIDGREESSSYVPKFDSAMIYWTRELSVFESLNDVNNSNHVGKYRTQSAEKDVTSNLTIYSLKSTEELPVSYLKIYYLNNLADIRKIEGLYREENSLLKTSRHLLMEFQNVNNKIVLTSYSVQGGQKMLLGDSVTFSIHGLVTLP